MSEIEKDSVTGVETTGHEWDGLKELNLPAPRWWLLVFLVTVIWGVGYMVLYPAWPTLSGEGVRGGTPGTKGWTQYSELRESQQEIFARRAAYLDDFSRSSYSDIQASEELFAFAKAGGQAAFKDNCATCHGTGGAGAPGYPNLNDDSWLWGGTLDDIETSIRYGIRAEHPDTRLSEMPAFGDMLSLDEVYAVADHVLSLSGRGQGSPVGAEIFEGQCSACHGLGGEGMTMMGAPNLSDAIWHYGGSRVEIAQQIYQPRHGQMPAWVTRLDDDTIRQLTVFVHSLGGGQQTEPEGAR